MLMEESEQLTPHQVDRGELLVQGCLFGTPYRKILHDARKKDREALGAPRPE